MGRSAGSIFLGIFIGISLTGPILGFLLGSACSAVYVKIGGKHLSQSNPGYIGAWWLGELLLTKLMQIN